MTTLLQGDPYNLQGNTQPLQGGTTATVLQPTASPTAPAPALAPAPAPTTVKAPATTSTPTTSTVSFYKPDPNSPQVYNAQGQPLSYEQYIAQGGLANFSNVINGAIPGTAPPTNQTFSLMDGTYDVNRNVVQQPKAGAIPVPTTPPAVPATADPNQTRIGELTKQLFSTATLPNQQKLYEDAYNASGLLGLKTKLTDLNTRIADLTAKFTAKEGDINENPFLSEASRIGRLKQLTDQRNAEIGNLLDQYKQYANLYNEGVDEVNKSVERQVGDFNTSRQIGAEELNYLLGIEKTRTDQQATIQKNASTFAKDNNVTARFYKYPGNDTVYDSRTGEALSYDEYKNRGGAGVPGAAFPDVQTIQSQLKTISEGQSLYDPSTGKIIVTLPKSYKPSGGTSGGTGGLSAQAQAILSGTLKLEDLTPTVRGQIAGELLSAGYARTENLNATQRESIDSYDTLLREANNALVLVDKVDTGPLAGRVGAIGSKLGVGSQDFINYNSIISNFSSILLRLRSGAAVTPQEYERIAGFIPTITDDEKTARVKIERFISEINIAQQNYIKRATQTSQQIANPTQSGGSSVNLNDLF